MRNHLHILFLTIFILIFAGCQDDLDIITSTSPISDLNKTSLDTGVIGDRVWNDLNQNGLQDDGEPGIEGWPVGLIGCNDGSFRLTHTDANGNYFFDNLPSSSYKLKFHPNPGEEGWVFTTRDAGDDTKDSDVNPVDSLTVCFDLSVGESNFTWDAGFYLDPSLLGKLGDRVWNDLNQNGLQDDGEPGIQGWPVGLIGCDDGSFRLTHTDANGNYFFDNLPSGSYKLKFHPNPGEMGWTFTKLDAGDDTKDSDVNPVDSLTVCFELNAGNTDFNWDAGFYKVPLEQGNLGNRVWFDKDKDGIQDYRELGIRNVKVDLFDCFGNYIKSTSTNYFGYYFFRDLPAGSYKIKFNALPNHSFTKKDQGWNDEADSDVDVETGFTDCIILEGGTTENKWDAGLIEIEKVKPRGYGYWKTHSKYGPSKYDSAWGIIGEDTKFFHSGQTWFQVIRTSPKKGNVYYILTHQYIAARLNEAAGVLVPTSVADAINKATILFENYKPKDIEKLRWNNYLRREFLNLASLLNKFNEEKWFSRFFNFD